jgi:hypothetical protein
MEFGLRLSRLIEGRASEAAKFTAGLLPHFLTDKRATLKWGITATLGARDRAGKDKSD